MKTAIELKAHGHPPLEVLVDVDHRHRRLTLHMLEFDADLVATFLEDALERDFGVRAEDFAVAVALAGRSYPVQLLRVPSKTGEERLRVRLVDLDTEFIGRCQVAVEQLLSGLHDHGIDAIVMGVDEFGRPEPNEGFLQVVVNNQGNEEQAKLARRLSREVGHRTNVDFVVDSGEGVIVGLHPHFAWDKELGLVTRNTQD